MTYKDILDLNPGMKYVKTNLSSIIDDMVEHKNDISRSEYDAIIKILVKGLTLNKTNMVMISDLFKIYIPNNTQLNSLIKSTNKSALCDFDNEWIMYLSNNGFVFDDENRNKLINDELTEFFINDLNNDTEEPFTLLCNTLRHMKTCHIDCHYLKIKNFIKKNIKKISENNIHELCVLLCEKKSMPNFNLALFLQKLDINKKNIIKLFDHMLNSQHDTSNVPAVLKHITNIYNQIGQDIQLSHEHFKSYVLLSNNYVLNDINDNYPILKRKIHTNFLVCINDMLNKIDNVIIYEFALNNLVTFDRINKVIDKYNDIIQNIENHNVKCNEITFNFACKTNNTIIINKCIKQMIAPSNECINYAISFSNQLLVKYCLTHMNATEKHLQNACAFDNVNIIKQILDTKLIPSQICFINVLNNDDTKIDVKKQIIILFLEYGGIINIPTLKWIICAHAMTPEIFKYNISYDDYFDICHYYCKINDNVEFINFDEPCKKLYKFIHDNENYDTIIDFKNKNNIEFDKYCYDLMLIKQDSNYSKTVNDAIKNKKYNVTCEAIARSTCVVYRQHLFGKYFFNTSFNL